MGSGKSSVGRNLAASLNLPFIDLDLEIEKEEGTSVSNIFSEKGEIYFRKKENTVLKDQFLNLDNFVLATGGGTPCYGDVLPFMLSQEDTTVIYLKASLEVLTARLFKEKEQRPLVAHLKSKEAINDFIRKHLFERAFYYNQASIIVNNDFEAISETVKEIKLKLV